MKIRVKNDIDKRKEIKLGFSWTMFFFGMFVPLFRGDWKWFLIILGIEAALTITGLVFIAPFILIGLSFGYNQLYAKDLYDKGYRGLTPEENQELIKYITD